MHLNYINPHKALYNIKERVDYRVSPIPRQGGRI